MLGGLLDTLHWHFCWRWATGRRLHIHDRTGSASFGNYIQIAAAELKQPSWTSAARGKLAAAIMSAFLTAVSTVS